MSAKVANAELVIVPDPEHGHLIEVWEPLATKAPNPAKTQPYCCYVNTVVFYLRPYVVRPWHHLWTDGKRKRRAEKPGTMFEEWDRIETELRLDALVEFNGRKFRCYNGRVKWKDGRWWMRRDARAVDARDSRYCDRRGAVSSVAA